MTVGRRVVKWVEWLDRHPAVVMALLTPFYVVLILPQRYRQLWFDELYTFYIAQAPTFPRFVDEVATLDLNPPLLYGLVRVSMKLFGTSEIAVRLPSIVAYFAASVGMFVYLRRRVGALWAVIGIGFLWYSPFFYFAGETRPYSLLLAFFTLALCAWDSATGERPPDSGRTCALAGIFVGSLGMMLSHAYAPLSIMPFCAAELVHDWQKRRIDWAIWVALLLPLLSAAMYLPMIRNAGQAVFPVAFQGSLDKLVWFYLKVFFHVFFPLLLAVIPAFFIASRQKNVPEKKPRFTAPELTLLAVALLPPAMLNLLSMRTHSAYYDRYGITSVLAMYVLVVLFVAYEAKTNRLAGAAAAVIVLGFLFVPVAQALRAEPPSIAYKSWLEGSHAELPIVTNSGLTFLGMDRYESSALLSRLYYLTDRDSAIQFAHSTLLEGMPLLARDFPVRANVAPWSEFTAQHHHFLVLGIPDDTGAWLLRKLKAEGATMTDLGKMDSPYDDTELFEVTLANR